MRLMGESVEQMQSLYEKFLPQWFYAVFVPLTSFAVVLPINVPMSSMLLMCAPLIVIIVGTVAIGLRAQERLRPLYGYGLRIL